MQCAACGGENRESARFCENCGAKLRIVCPDCGSEVRPTARFCDSCGRSLQPALASEPDEERRIVTVLFADLVGFTPLAERLDPEQVRAVQRSYFDRMSQEISRFEGTIEKFAGDAVLALFGAPIAHEDDPQRAVRCALSLQTAMQSVAAETSAHWGVDLALRVGINTGAVVSGVWDVGGRMDHSVSGDAVNTAARLQTAAPPGAVAVAENTYRLTRDYFEWESMGHLTVKGKQATVAAYRPLSARNVVHRVEAANRLTPFVGREDEIGAIERAFERAAQGEGQVIFLSGEPGIGKSRLLLELRRRIPDTAATWLEGRCVSYGRSIPYLPMIDLLRRSMEISEDDPEERSAEIIGAITEDWEQGAKETVPFLKYLLGIDPGDSSILSIDPMQRRAGIIEGLRAFTVMQARERPLILAVEDLHWVDEESEAALATLADLAASLPVMVLLTYRPERAPSLGERGYDTRLPLSRLPSEDGVAIAEAVLSVARLPEEIRSLVVSRAEGNPLYIEELVRSLMETGALHRRDDTYALNQPPESVHVPETIQEIILSRIDRLDREAKTVIQLASVIGRDFTLRLLEQISNRTVGLDRALRNLKQVELIRQTGFFPEQAYTFKHALTHDVAYSTLLNERRQALHRSVAGAIETLYSDRLADQFETLARHYLRGEEWRLAMEYAIKAAEKAFSAYANAEAVTFYRQAETAAGQIRPAPRETLIAIHTGIAEALYALNRWDEGAASYLAASDIAGGMGAYHEQGHALCGASTGFAFGHDFDRAEALAHEALALSARTGDRGVEGNVLLILGMLNALRGKLTEAKQQLEPALKRLLETGQTSSAGEALGLLGVIDEWQGEYDRAREKTERAVALAAGQGSVPFLLDTTFTKVLSLMSAGRYEEAVGILVPQIERCRRMGEQSFQGRFLNTLGWVYLELGDWDRAERFNRESLQLGANLGDPEIVGNCRANLADIAVGVGNPTAAIAELEPLYESLPTTHEWMKWRYAQHMIHSLGEAVLQLGDPERALRLADECLALAEASESRKNLVKVRRLRAQALFALGRSVEAAADAAEALVLARAVGNPRQLWETLTVGGDLLAGSGHTQEAKEMYLEARGEIDRVASTLSDEILRATFLASSRVAPLRDRITAVSSAQTP